VVVGIQGKFQSRLYIPLKSYLQEVYSWKTFPLHRNIAPSALQANRNIFTMTHSLWSNFVYVSLCYMDVVSTLVWLQAIVHQSHQ